MLTLIAPKDSSVFRFPSEASSKRDLSIRQLGLTLDWTSQSGTCQERNVPRPGFLVVQGPSEMLARVSGEVKGE